MGKFWQAIKANSNTTVIGIGALLAAVGMFLQTGEIDSEAILAAILGLLGLTARDGGDGSNAA